MLICACAKLAGAVHYLLRRRVSSDELLRKTGEGEGACLSVLADRSHLPLRGKLGWMTPRAGVKTTLAIETRLTGPPIPSGGPIFLSAPPKRLRPEQSKHLGCGNERQLDEAGLTGRVVNALGG